MKCFQTCNFLTGNTFQTVTFINKSVACSLTYEGTDKMGRSHSDDSVFKRDKSPFSESCSAVPNKDI